MPLEPIGHPARAIRTNRLSRRRLLAGASVFLSGAILTGCAEGRVRDAQRGKEEDASRESVVKDLQATETWNIIHGTPASTPSPEE